MIVNLKKILFVRFNLKGTIKVRNNEYIREL